MRLFLLLAAACALQGCATLIGAGIASDTNRQRRAEATTTGVDLAEHPPVPGDTLTLVLVRGDTLRGAVAAVTRDSLHLDTGAVALTDIERAERPWTRAEFGRTLAVAAAVDMAILWLVMRDLTFTGGFGSFNFD